MKKTSIYLDEEVDQALAAQAAEEGVSKAEFIRRNLEVVVSRPKRPRLSVGKLRRLPGYVPHPGGDDAELSEILDRRDREEREPYRSRAAS
ncbi:MAG: ribbon-helix-helix protein, CopG family [Solirubrobacterales bacterium]|nr:ribbon-helix-helix protein, CopG family [Solirubrobacterales bacterium]